MKILTPLNILLVMFALLLYMSYMLVFRYMRQKGLEQSNPWQRPSPELATEKYGLVKIRGGRRLGKNKIELKLDNGDDLIPVVFDEDYIEPCDVFQVLVGSEPPRFKETFFRRDDLISGLKKALNESEESSETIINKYKHLSNNMSELIRTEEERTRRLLESGVRGRGVKIET